VSMKDDPRSLDRLTLMLTSIYKFSRNGFVVAEAAWDVAPNMASSRNIEDKISRVHLAEEFCHWRLFDEMLRTCGLDRVEWRPLSPVKEVIYCQFTRLPGFLSGTLAFVAELTELTYYFYLRLLFDELLNHEPEVRDRLRELLEEITIDKIARVGQRRNFIGPIGIWISQILVKPCHVLFFNDIPEAGLLFDIHKMIKYAQSFDFNEFPDFMAERSWIPSYCKVQSLASPYWSPWCKGRSSRS